MNTNRIATSLFMIVPGLIIAFFGLAQGLMVQHPTAPLFILGGVAGVTLTIFGIIYAAKTPANKEE